MNQAAAPRHSTVSIVVAITVSVVAAMVSNTLPAFLAVLARARGLSESQSGLSAMADLGGIAFGMTLCGLLPGLVRRLTWRGTIASGLLLLIAANLLSIWITSFEPYLAVRILAGTGSGIVIAIVYAVLAEGDGARSLAAFNVGQLASASFAIPFFSKLAEAYGIAILFAIVAGMGAASLLLVPALPRESVRELAAEDRDSHANETVSLAGWLAIISVLVMFVGVGSLFGFLSYMGAAWGGDPLQVESDVSKVVFSGMLGALAVAIVGSRFGYQRPMIIGFALLLAAAALFAVFKPLAGFLAVGALFYFAVNVTMTYQFEAVTEIDTTSSAAMLVSAATLGGTAVGPAIAGYLVTEDYMLVNLLGLVAFASSLALLLAAQALHRRQPARA
jgi:predicted MFS family arabinose efflux permease